MPWNNVATTLTTVLPAAYGTGLYDEPVGTAARTLPRTLAGTNMAIASGSTYARMIILPAGFTAGAMTMAVASTAKAGGTHGWYGVMDQNHNILTTTADQTDANTVWAPGSTSFKLPFSQLLVAPYTGVYYVLVCVTATTPPSFAAGASILGGLQTPPPPVGGIVGSGLNVPPAPGTNLATFSAFGAQNFYAALSPS